MQSQEEDAEEGKDDRAKIVFSYGRTTDIQDSLCFSSAAFLGETPHIEGSQRKQRDDSSSFLMCQSRRNAPRVSVFDSKQLKQCRAPKIAFSWFITTISLWFMVVITIGLSTNLLWRPHIEGVEFPPGSLGGRWHLTRSLWRL